MRPLEVVLIIVDVVTLLVLVVPLRDRASWLRRSALIALPAMGAQLLVEGSRWQMVPAYLLSGLFFLVWLMRTVVAAAQELSSYRTRWCGTDEP
jgi:hypothetical protein